MLGTAQAAAHDRGGIAIAGDDGCRPSRNLPLVETLAEFRARLRARGNILEVAERQRVVRLLVQEILVGGDNITIRHSIPLPAFSPDSNHGVRPSPEPPEPNTGSCYLLRSNSLHAWYSVSKLPSTVSFLLDHLIQTRM
jgi:hypothetical protein